jgi:hypothetical protein
LGGGTFGGTTGTLPVLGRRYFRGDYRYSTGTWAAVLSGGLPVLYRYLGGGTFGGTTGTLPVLWQRYFRETILTEVLFRGVDPMYGPVGALTVADSGVDLS